MAKILVESNHKATKTVSKCNTFSEYIKEYIAKQTKETNK